MERFMNHELKKEIKRQKDLQKGWKKKFDEELFELGGNVLDYEGNIRPKQHLPLDAIKSFIDKHLISRYDVCAKCKKL